MKDIKTEKMNESPFINNSDIVKFKDCGNVKEIMYSSAKKPRGSPITKLNNELYILNETGEVKNFNHISNRSQDLKSIARTMQNGRDVINTNVTNVANCRWITLTYADNMTNTKKLYTDTDNLMRKLHDKYGKFEYITCNEPQGRGAWHIHMLMIFDYKAPYIPCKELQALWGKGFCKVKKLDDVDNVGAYLTAYLGDLELSACIDDLAIKNVNVNVKEVDVIDENGQPIKKRFVKGARLYMYPPNFRIFRWSKGIKKPVISYITNDEAEKKVSSDKLTYEKTVTLTDDETNFNATLNYRYYNTTR